MKASVTAPELHPPAWAVGDIHGQIAKLMGLLLDQKLVDAKGNWSGNNASLWLLGDFVDRGLDSVGVLDLVMRLQRQAADIGGEVRAVLGNHDATLLSAYLLGGAGTSGPRGTFLLDWEHNGGLERDLTRLADRHVEWLRSLPAVGRGQERIYMHADSLFYTDYGQTVQTINDKIGDIMNAPDADAWDTLLKQFSDRDAFSDRRPNGMTNARRFLEVYGGRQIIHGHTPICKVTGEPAAAVATALIYADDLCVNVDGGMYLGGPGFVFAVEPFDTPVVL